MVGQSSSQELQFARSSLIIPYALAINVRSLYTTVLTAESGIKLTAPNQSRSVWLICFILSSPTTGIGPEATKQLASYSPSKVIMAVRNLEAGHKVALELTKRYPKIDFQVWQLDVLSEFQVSRAFVERALKDLDHCGRFG